LSDHHHRRVVGLDKIHKQGIKKAKPERLIGRFETKDEITTGVDFVDSLCVK
jgi:hypothetical protein